MKIVARKRVPTMDGYQALFVHKMNPIRLVHGAARWEWSWDPKMAHDFTEEQANTFLETLVCPVGYNKLGTE